MWRAIDDGPLVFRRELRRRGGPASAAAILAEQVAVADALADALAAAEEVLNRFIGDG